MKLPKKIEEWWPLALLIGLLTSIGWFGGQIAHAAAEPFWKHIAPAIPQTLLLSLCCFLIAVIILLGIWVIYLHRSLDRLQHAKQGPNPAELAKQFHDQFADFVEHLGVWTHKTKPGWYCPKCKADEVESRMRLDESSGSCPVCRYTFLR